MILRPIKTVIVTGKRTIGMTVNIDVKVKVRHPEFHC